MFIMLHGEVIRDDLHLDLDCCKFFGGFDFNNATFCIHKCFSNLYLKAYHDLLSACPCDILISKTHPQSSMNNIRHCYLKTEIV